MLSQCLGQKIPASHWLWTGVALSMVLSCLYHAELKVEWIVVSLGLLGILRILCRQMAKTGLKFTPRGASARTLFLLAFALAAMMAAYQLNKPPQVYWHFDTDSYTWRPTLPWLYEAWGEKKRGIALHPVVGSDKTESVFGPWRAVAKVDRIYPGFQKSIILQVTEPEWGVFDAHNKLSAEPVAGPVSIIFEANRDGVWTALHSRHLDPRNHVEERTWHNVVIDLAPDVREMRVSVEAQPSLSDTGQGTVWISVMDVRRSDSWFGESLIVRLNDLIWTAFVGWLSLLLMLSFVERLKARGYFDIAAVGSLNRSGFLWGISLCCLLMAPTAAWVFIDHTPFGGDQSQYAEATLDLVRAWTYSPGAWASKMVTALKFKPPGIAWLGQLFVGPGRLMGSINMGLLLSIVATLFAALVLVFWSLWTLSAGNLAIALSGAILMASSPLFASLSHEYLAEPMQVFSVAWFVFIMCRAPAWSSSLIFAQLTGAASVALLAKTSSPLYCMMPGTVAFGFAIWWRTARQQWTWRSLTTCCTSILAIVLALWMVGWYSENLGSALTHMSMSSAGPVAELWGKHDTLINSLSYWLNAIWESFFSSASWFVWTAILLAGLVAFLSKAKEAQKYTTVCAVAALVQQFPVERVRSIHPVA